VRALAEKPTSADAGERSGSGEASRDGAADALSAAEAAKLKADAEQRARDAEVASLEQQLAATEAEVGGGARALGLLQDRARQADAELAAADHQALHLDRDVAVKAKTLEMLPLAAQHIAQLQGVCAASAQKLQDLGGEWEKHRAPLVASLRAKRDFATSRRARCKAMVAEMQKCRVEMQAMAKEVRAKEDQAAQLEDELAKLPQNVNRTLYTYRIMDIIGSIAKQKKEIDKIIAEVAAVQKDINATGEKLSRAEVLADEKIFSYAKQEAHKKDQQVVSCYRHFGDLRARFDDLVGVIEAVGKREADSRDLSRKTEQLAERVSKNNTARIVEDLRQVQQENAGLVQQLRALKAAATQADP
jgi:chromosome segregation ATPase